MLAVELMYGTSEDVDTGSKREELSDDTERRKSNQLA
jgi:hypothetical protein